MSKQLTRDEAIDAIRAVDDAHGVGGTCKLSELQIDRLIAIGVFTPAEPKTIDDEVIDALKGHWGAPRNIIADIKAAGFKIVKA